MNKFEGIRYLYKLNSGEIQSNLTGIDSISGVVYLEVDTT